VTEQVVSVVVEGVTEVDLHLVRAISDGILWLYPKPRRLQSWLNRSDKYPGFNFQFQVQPLRAKDRVRMTPRLMTTRRKTNKTLPSKVVKLA
jgi:hypothetical protein